MTGTPQQHRGNQAQVNEARPGQPASAIYTSPLGRLPSRAQAESAEQARARIEALVREDAIDLRVDWDGSAASQGRFEVLVAPGAWQACELIDTGSLNDVVSLGSEITGDTFLARFRRGPAHGACRFAVKAVPIAWSATSAASLAPVYVAERGKDYVYADGAGPKAIPWIDAVLASGMHTLTIALSTRCAYEVWVHLQAPGNPDNWLELDPIVRPGNGGGNPS